MEGGQWWPTNLPTYTSRSLLGIPDVLSYSDVTVFTVPTGTTFTVPSGWPYAVFNLQIDGELVIDGECIWVSAS